MSRYDWSRAPDWARYAATDEDGESFWFESKPSARELIGEWVIFGEGRHQSMGNWTDSLEVRPIYQFESEARVNIGAKP